jgi:hypothetical protein
LKFIYGILKFKFTFFLLLIWLPHPSLMLMFDEFSSL